jgi:hypothetical protein
MISHAVVTDAAITEAVMTGRRGCSIADVAIAGVAIEMARSPCNLP